MWLEAARNCLPHAALNMFDCYRHRSKNPAKKMLNYGDKTLSTPSFSLKLSKTFKRNTLLIGIASSGKS